MPPESWGGKMWAVQLSQLIALREFLGHGWGCGVMGKSEEAWWIHIVERQSWEYGGPRRQELKEDSIGEEKILQWHNCGYLQGVLIIISAEQWSEHAHEDSPIKTRGSTGPGIGPVPTSQTGKFHNFWGIGYSMHRNHASLVRDN